MKDIIKEQIYFTGTEQMMTIAYLHEENEIVVYAKIIWHLRNLRFHQFVLSELIGILLTSTSKSISRWFQGNCWREDSLIFYETHIKETVGISPAHIIIDIELKLISACYYQSAEITPIHRCLSGPGLECILNIK